MKKTIIEGELDDFNELILRINVNSIPEEEKNIFQFL